MTAPAVAHLGEDLLFLDLEVSQKGGIQDIGAIRGTESLHTKSGNRKGLNELANLGAGASVIAGHNFLEFDRKHRARPAASIHCRNFPSSTSHGRN